MGTGFVMVENLFRGHPPGEHPLHHNPFFIRDGIRKETDITDTPGGNTRSGWS